MGQQAPSVQAQNKINNGYKSISYGRLTIMYPPENFSFNKAYSNTSMKNKKGITVMMDYCAKLLHPVNILG